MAMNTEPVPAPQEAAAPSGLQTKEMALPDALAFAVDLQRVGRLSEAAGILRAVLTTEPDYPDALMYFGVLAHQAGESDAGEALVRRAIELAPGFASAHINLGNLLRERQRVAEAEQSYRQALAIAPADADALCNLGSIHNQRGEFEQAFDCFRRAIERVPGHAEALHNMGNACRGLGRVDEAIAAYEQAGKLGGGLAADQRRAGHALTGMGRYPQAVEFFQRALAMDPGDTDAMRGLARVHTLARATDKAIAAYTEWLRLKPGDPVALHMLGALTDGAAPRASDAYVRKTFDDFANSFDMVLQSLEYRAPKLVASALAEVSGSPTGQLRILDAGCGTGLVGVELRSHAAWLVGVDLSAGMLAKARARGAYDQLDEGELVDYLARASAAWDALTCADTLCYFGALDGFAEAAAAALRPGGWLAFTVEHEEGDGPYRIEAHGRYSHARGYVESVFSAAGFSGLRLDEVVLRLELGQPVAGLLGLVRRAPSPLPT